MQARGEAGSRAGLGRMGCDRAGQEMPGRSPAVAALCRPPLEGQVLLLAATGQPPQATRQRERTYARPSVASFQYRA